MEVRLVGRVHQSGVVLGLRLGLLVGDTATVAQVSIGVALAYGVSMGSTRVAQRLLVSLRGDIQALGIGTAVVDIGPCRAHMVHRFPAP